MEGKTERIEFESANHIRLVGEIDWPTTPPPHPAVAFAHGLDSSKKSSCNLPIAHRLNEEGIAALRFDFTGHGESGGTRKESTVEQQIADLRAAINYLASKEQVSRIGVNGSSSGGLPALWLACEDYQLSALVLREPHSEGVEKEAHRIQAPTLFILGGKESPFYESICRLAGHLTCEYHIEIIGGGGYLFEDVFETMVEKTADWFRRYLL